MIWTGDAPNSSPHSASTTAWPYTSNFTNLIALISNSGYCLIWTGDPPNSSPHSSSTTALSYTSNFTNLIALIYNSGYGLIWTGDAPNSSPHSASTTVLPYTSNFTNLIALISNSGYGLIGTGNALNSSPHSASTTLTKMNFGFHSHTCKFQRQQPRWPVPAMFHNSHNISGLLRSTTSLLMLFMTIAAKSQDLYTAILTSIVQISLFKSSNQLIHSIESHSRII